jgi:hypothetical protein
VPHVANPPAYLARSSVSKYVHEGRVARFVGDGAPLPPRPATCFSLEQALTNMNWSLSSIDEGVRRGVLEFFRKAGKAFIRIL